MDVIINKLNGSSLNLSDYEITVRDFIVESIPLNSLYGNIEGMSGTIDYGADFGQRNIRIPIFFKSKDSGDYPVLRDELFNMVVTKEPFYIREMRVKDNRIVNSCDDVQSLNSNLVGGKRYLVRISDSFDIEQTFDYGFGELVFESVGTPFAESVGTSQDIHKKGIINYPELWGYGMGLIDDPNSLIYTFNSNSFKIYNPGNVEVNPFDSDFKIVIKNTIYKPENVDKKAVLRNITNGSKITFTESLDRIKNITIDKLKITRSTRPYLRYTEKTYISLEPGWNEFRFNNLTSAEISFDFRFYYK